MGVSNPVGSLPRPWSLPVGQRGLVPTDPQRNLTPQDFSRPEPREKPERKKQTVSGSPVVDRGPSRAVPKQLLRRSAPRRRTPSAVRGSVQPVLPPSKGTDVTSMRSRPNATAKRVRGEKRFTQKETFRPRRLEARRPYSTESPASATRTPFPAAAEQKVVVNGLTRQGRETPCFGNLCPRLSVPPLFAFSSSLLFWLVRRAGNCRGCSAGVRAVAAAPPRYDPFLRQGDGFADVARIARPK